MEHKKESMNPSAQPQANETDSKRNSRIVAMCLAMVFGMGGLAYASVPLYDLFCRVTGYGGTTQVADASDATVIKDRMMNVRFDANTSAGLDWKFRPVTRNVELRLGEKMQVSYVAENLSDQPLTGTATFNVTPQAAGAYFNKIECFCFTETNIEPGGTLDMPVVFFIDPEITEVKELEYVETITLSYTFFRTDADGEIIQTTQTTDINLKTALNSSGAGLSTEADAVQPAKPSEIGGSSEDIL